MAEQEPSRRFGPLHVVDDQEQRLLDGDGPDQSCDGLEQPPPLRLGIGDLQTRGERPACRQFGPQVHELISARADHALQRDRWTRREPRGERLDDRLVRRGQTLVAAAMQDAEAACQGLAGGRGRQTRLAHARLTDQ